MGNSHKGKENKNDLTYLLCPGCFTRVPTINIFFENCIPKVKLYCSCEVTHSRPIIMGVSEYIDKMRLRDPLLLKCENHLEVRPQTFCLNCEKWLCEECIKTVHNEKTCQPISDGKNEFCTKHVDLKMTSICKKCQKIMCDKCAEEHVAFWESNSRDSINKGKKHTIKKFNTFLSPEKMEKKVSKFKVFKIEVMKLNYDKMNDFLKKIDSENGKSGSPVPNVYKEKLEEVYNFNKDNNENLIELIQILFNNIHDQITKPITNKKLLYNVIINTSFNTDDNSIDCKTLKEEFEFLVNYYQTYFLNKTLTYQISKVQSLQETSESISLLCLLEKNKFAVAVEAVIQIWSGSTCQKIGNLVGHTNIIQSLCNLSNDKLASTSSDKAIKIWKISTCECLKTININGMPSFLFLNKLNPSEIAFVNFGKKIEVWNLDSSQREKEVEIANASWFENYCQLSDGDVLLGKGDGFIVLKSGTFEIDQDIKNLGDDPNIFSELDNQRIAVGMKKGDIIVYESNFKNPFKLVGHEKSITGITQLKEDMILSCCMDTFMKLWNTKTLECEETFVMNKFEINNMLKLNDNKIVTCLSENSVDIWKFEDFNN